MNKKERLMEIVEELLELYPHLDGALVEGSSEAPTKIVFVSYDDLEKIAEEYGIDVEHIEAEDDRLDLLDFIDDDDEAPPEGGYLQ